MTHLSRFGLLRVLRAAEHTATGAVRRDLFLTVWLALLCGLAVIEVQSRRFEVTHLSGWAVAVMGLLNHLAFGFALPASRARRRLRVAARAFTCFTAGVIFTVCVLTFSR